MNKPVKILHVDPDYKATYFINRPGSLIRSHISLDKAIQLLKTKKFDLILSEPHNKAVLNPQDHLNLFFSNELKKRVEEKRNVAV
jgi:hypothetical protein